MLPKQILSIQNTECQLKKPRKAHRYNYIYGKARKLDVKIFHQTKWGFQRIKDIS